MPKKIILCVHNENSGTNNIYIYFFSLRNFRCIFMLNVEIMKNPDFTLPPHHSSILPSSHPPSRFLLLFTSVLLSRLLCGGWLLGVGSWPVAMVTAMWPGERNRVAPLVQTAAVWFAAAATAVLTGVFGVLVIGAAVVWILVGGRCLVLWVAPWQNLTHFYRREIFFAAFIYLWSRAQTHADICERQLDVSGEVELLGLSFWQRLVCLDDSHVIDVHPVQP